MSEHAAIQPNHHQRSSLRAGTAVALAIVVAVAACAWFLANRGGTSTTSASSTTGAHIATQAGIAATARSLAHPIYWAGARPGMSYELTATTSGSVYVRYLPAGVKAGDPRAKFITVGTYPKPNAYAVLAAARKIASARVQTYGTNVIAVSYPNRPHSVYVAHRGSSSMIEVFAPTSLGAETIVRAGLIVPVR